ncbi:MAG TPA: hydroxyacylglutathione hydrolase [Candidatus Acidoferrum sp.]|nr:hydroxyacylglutathione hydrolase [Candidatus Acidoferrum sp.]
MTSALHSIVRLHEIDPREARSPTYTVQINPILSPRGDYAYLVHDRTSGTTAVIDPVDASPVLKLAHAQDWRIEHVLVTHHHSCAGALAIKRATGCAVHGPAADAERIPGLDVRYGGGEFFRLGNLQFDVLAVPGHTLGDLAYWMPMASALFCGDTLTPLGCGRIMESTAPQLWRSLCLIRELPAQTLLYGGSECALANARFALSLTPDDPWLQARGRQIDSLHHHRRGTVPSLLEDEFATNPFLRADDRDFAAALGLGGASELTVFAELHRRRALFEAA